MKRVLSPRESGSFIAKEAKNITIVDSGINELSERIVKNLQDGTLQMSRFSQCEVHPSVANEDAINWIFVVDTLNFCFWSSLSEKWCITWRGKSYTGYFALCAAINRALDDGYPITDPVYYSTITINELKKIFRSDNGSICIPLLSEREKCLCEVGKVLLERFGGSFVNCIRSSNCSSEKLLDIIVENFSCYRDEGTFNSVKVSFYKRAQILIGDIWVCFKGRDLGFFKDIEKLTMFADYRIPQVLVHFGAMKYGNSLSELLKKDEILEYGSQEEMEIRGCSIYIVERVMDRVRALLPDVKGNVSENENGSIICNSILIDHFLWDYRREHAEELECIPFHKTLSIFY